MAVLNLWVLGLLLVPFLWVLGRNRKSHHLPSSTTLGNAMNRPFSRTSDPLVHHGRHFGCTVHAMCNVQALITNGILQMAAETSEEYLPSQCANSDRFDTNSFLIFLHRARKEYRIFRRLLGMVPHLEERLMECMDDEVMGMGELVHAFGWIHVPYVSQNLFQDPKRYILCEVRRHQEYQRRHPRLDNAPGCPAESAPCSQR
jgi:hypothetical protein